MGLIIQGREVSDPIILTDAGDKSKSSLNIYYILRSDNPMMPFVNATKHITISPLLYCTESSFFGVAFVTGNRGSLS